MAIPNRICEIPERHEFLYNVNMALLYGAKGIDVNDYYYFMDGDTLHRTGMVGVNQTGNYVKYYTPIWFTLHDTISPLLKGAFGKALKNIQQSEQGELFASTGSLDLAGASFASIYGDYDCGTFISPSAISDKKYVMAVSRYYNRYGGRAPQGSITISKNVEANQKNYKVTDLFDGTIYNKYSSSSTVTLTKIIRPGQAILLEIVPTIKYGGTIVGNETVSSSETLLDNLIINSNQQLSISGSTTVYSLTDTVTIQTGASIYCTQGGKINAQFGGLQFLGTGKIIFQNWYSSLFFTSENGHPKLVWGYQAGPKTYHVYKYTGGSWVNIANVTTTTTDITHKQYYVDTEEDIYSGGNYVRYKVIEGTSNETNEVSIHVLPKELDEANQLITEFKIEQNYPNPFNPSTTISYSIPSTGRVSVILYDMLGREVRNLFNGIQPMGSYFINVNCGNLASGVYIYRIQHNNQVLSKKMILQK